MGPERCSFLILSRDIKYPYALSESICFGSDFFVAFPANYSYLADGTKLAATDAAGDGLVYAGSLVYKKQGNSLNLESAAFAGGRFIANQTSAGTIFTPQYYLTDHLGSTRVVIDGNSGNVTERNDYYPYGKRWNDANSQLSDNRYKFNGKEEQSFINLPYTDYGARQYNPTLGRWFNIDPLAELDISVSPFAFCANNTLSYIDIDGNIKWPVPKTYNGGIRRHENNYGAPRGAGRTHKGIDINIGSKADDFGAPVYATHDGVVTRVVHINSGDKDAGGTRIQITSNGGEVSTFYMHLATIEDNIQKGVYIHEGMQIGTLGGSGNGIEDRYTPHLHYEIRINGELVNPAIDKTDLLNLCRFNKTN